MRLLLVLTSLVASLILPTTSAYPARDVKKFPCHKYLDIISNWPDGFRGILKLPVLDVVKNMRDKMQNGDVILTFNKSITTLDIPQGDHQKRKVDSKRKEYRVFIKFQHELTRLRKGGVFKLDISVHFPRWKKGNTGISAIQFGDFHCPSVAPTPPPIPTCGVRMIDNTPPDGYRAQMLIPIGKETHTKWDVEVFFTRPLQTFDVPSAVKIDPQARDVQVFKMHNRSYNNRIVGPTTFPLEFMVHFDRNRHKKRDVKIGYIKFNGKIVCKAPQMDRY